MDRKPLAPIESLDPHTIRFSPGQWARIVALAAAWRMEPSVLVRVLTMYALTDTALSRRLEGAGGMLGRG